VYVHPGLHEIIHHIVYEPFFKPDQRARNELFVRYNVLELAAGLDLVDQLCVFELTKME
jgi:hypothetical protein